MPSDFCKYIKIWPIYGRKKVRKAHFNDTFILSVVGSDRTSEFFKETRSQNDLIFWILTENYEKHNKLSDLLMSFLQILYESPKGVVGLLQISCKLLT